MPKSKLPVMSVVVITYNDGSGLPPVLESLMAQSYPKNRYEVIVVDDGSTDDTATIISRYPRVRYIKHPENRGIPVARNSGLAAMKGDIYVSFDDDCVADPDWLAELANGYQTDNPAGVGGTLLMPEFPTGLTSRYLSICDYYLGPRQAYVEQPRLRPWHRLWRYIRTGTQLPYPTPRDAVVVEELYGANSSFPKAVLLAVNGWRETMAAMEDRDISHRIREQFPDRPLLQIPTAKLQHTGKHRLSQYLLRPLQRGYMNLTFYQDINRFPPVFPFPIIFLLFSVVLGVEAPIWLPVGWLLLPQILYFWWPYRTWRHRQPLALCFAYLQLVEESAVMLGLLRGYYQLRTKAEGPRVT
jgi:glycosyltransferase involved in cell wall biosynthesis